MPAHQGKFVAYFRVSTDRQGKSGHGLEAQRKSVLDYLDGGGGRPHKLTPHQRQEALARREAGETLMDIARSYGVSHPTISRL